MFRNRARAGEEPDGFTSPRTAPGPGSRCTWSSPQPPAGRGTAGQTLCPADTVPATPAEEVAGRTGAGLLPVPGQQIPVEGACPHEPAVLGGTTWLDSKGTVPNQASSLSTPRLCSNLGLRGGRRRWEAGGWDSEPASGDGCGLQPPYMSRKGVSDALTLGPTALPASAPQSRSRGPDSEAGRPKQTGGSGQGWVGLLSLQPQGGTPGEAGTGHPAQGQHQHSRPAAHSLYDWGQTRFLHLGSGHNLLTPEL